MRRLEREVQKLNKAIETQETEFTTRQDQIQLQIENDKAEIGRNETRQTKQIIAIERAVESNKQINAKLEVDIKVKRWNKLELFEPDFSNQLDLAVNLRSSYKISRPLTIINSRFKKFKGSRHVDFRTSFEILERMLIT